MIPIPPQVYVFILKYGQKLLIGLLVLSIILAGYFYWKHTVFKEGAKQKEHEWIEYNAKIAQQAQEIIDAANRRNALEREADHKRNLEAITSYVNYSKDLEYKLSTTPKRVFVPVKSDSKTCDSALPGKADVPQAPDRRGREVEWAELGEETVRTLQSNTAEVERMAWLLADYQRQIRLCSTVQ
jgi:hypothetical protein